MPRSTVFGSGTGFDVHGNKSDKLRIHPPYRPLYATGWVVDLMRTLLITATLLTVTLAGCFGFDSDDGFDYVPGENFKETGRTVHLKATVLDLVQKEIYPGMEANMWAFCFKPAREDDTYSANAIEYLPDQEVDTTETAWKGTCSTPGPTIRVSQGDKVIVDFENNHVHPHTIHWHGQYVPWESDGVPGSTQDSVKPGESFRYEFIASRAGSLWYHCHVDTQFHVMQGLYGMFIVEPQETQWEPDVDRDVVWTLGTLKRDLVEATPERVENPHVDHQNLGDCGVTGEQQCQNPPVDVTPDTFLINGVSFPKTLQREDTWILLQPDESIRLRILNAGTTVETIHTHGHDMLVTHIDGNPLHPNARYYVDTIPIMPAQRIDVVIEGREGNEGVWVVHTHVVDHVTNDGQYPGGMLSKIAYPGFENDLTPFAGVELAGGLPYTPPVVLPDDYDRSTTRGMETGAESSEQWSFPVELPCAVKSIRFNVEANAVSNAIQALNELHLEIFAPDGDEIVEEDLGTARSFEWIYDAQSSELHLDEGLYNVTLSGRAVDTTIRMMVAVDYYDSLEEMAYDGNPCEEDH